MGVGRTCIKCWRNLTAGRPLPRASPSVAIVAAQSVKCSERGVPNKGFDGHKQIQGRKRQLAIDTGGRLLAAHVGPANENDRTGGRAVLEKLHRQGFKRLKLVLTDAGYDGRPLSKWVQDHCGWRLETAPGLTGRGGFTPQPTRWLVERSSSWLHWDRRLSRDYECETPKPPCICPVFGTLFVNFGRLSAAARCMWWRCTTSG